MLFRYENYLTTEEHDLNTTDFEPRIFVAIPFIL